MAVDFTRRPEQIVERFLKEVTMTRTTGSHLLAAGTSGGHDTRLILAALIGIAVIIALITFAKLNPFLSLTIGSVLVGAIAGLGMDKTVTSFGNGVGSTVASVGTLIALGAIFGKLLADSGGADQLVDTIVGRASERALPWAMALVGMIIGLPMFFEIGLVLLMPVILLVARRSGLPLMRVAIPALAGLSAMHGFVPPHPGPLAAVGALNADLGLTLGLGVLVRDAVRDHRRPAVRRGWPRAGSTCRFPSCSWQRPSSRTRPATRASAEPPATGRPGPDRTASRRGAATRHRRGGSARRGDGRRRTGDPVDDPAPADRRPDFGITLPPCCCRWC